MQHIGQGFEVHQPVLNRHMQKRAQRKTVACGRIKLKESSRKLFVETYAGSHYILAHIIEVRPIRRHVGGQAPLDRVDAEGKKPIMLRMYALHAKHAISYQVPVERFEMSDIKNDAVALGNRPLVEGLAADDAEERITLSASMDETVREILAGFGAGLRGKHAGLHFKFSAARKRCRYGDAHSAGRPEKLRLPTPTHRPQPRMIKVMPVALFQVDAFAAKPFAGNPAAVCPLNAG